ncbi:glycosyltransferase [Flavivirga sp. 57AJ16]|uniref:glycosyltransferase n=1 Tax=Flavivirga sp. 57AJ16 TaxID=3025307 RepID=UPI00236652C9|nr:glycosyltransferase [Flavivirga sp. 57AJ16]MDD7885187.1 glycosyltransferase [Flavivirga sp. 57AJ16]
MHKNRIAIISPSKNSYSETFIQEQKNGLKGDVFYYYGGALPKYLENYGLLLTPYISLMSKLKQLVGVSRFTTYETAILKSMTKNKVQVVLAQYGPTGNRVLEICKFLKLPLVVHFHGYDVSVKHIVDQCGGYKEVFQYASKVIAVSRDMEKKLIDLGCDADKIVYNPCGPHKDFLEIKPNFSKKQFVSIGRFTKKKAPYYTILAFKKVMELYPDAQLIMAGDGELLEVCKNLVSFYGLEDHVKFSGAINRQECMALLRESLAFVQHSITADNGDKEGTPVAVLEASAVGLPVISTFHAGIPDVIEHLRTGLLSKEHDVDDMSKNMIKLIQDSALAKELGVAGKQRIGTHFNLEKHLNILQETIEST